MMKKHQLIFALALGLSFVAHAEDKKIPDGCVKLEDEIKFSAKDIYLDDVGHLTAGKLPINVLKNVDSKMPEVMEQDGISKNNSDDALIKGEVTLKELNLGSKKTFTAVNADSNPFSKLSLTVYQHEDEENVADISGSLKIKPYEIAKIGQEVLPLRMQIITDTKGKEKGDNPIAVCGVGVQLYVSSDNKTVRRGAIVLHVNVGGKEKDLAVQAINENRGPKASDDIVQTAEAPEADEGAGSAL